MSYLVLARKFRPQLFQSIVGQEHIWRGLANAIIQDRVPHALLFTGPRGVGKTTTARVFAKSLNCQNRPEQSELKQISFEEALLKVEPCNTCANCLEISRSASMAVWEIDGASNNSVENVRDLIDSLKSLPPPGSRFKIYIVDEVHMLSVAAFNALLKSLEEPPPNTVFLFATTEPHKVPDTVISRCQVHDFRRISTDAIEQKLLEIAQDEKITVDASAIRLIARKASGGMRDAESMLDRVIGFSAEKADLATVERILGFLDRQIFQELNAAVLDHDVAKCFAVIERIFEASIDLRGFLAEFVLSWRNVLAVKVLSESKRSVDDGVAAKNLGLTLEEFEQLKVMTDSLSVIDAHRLFELASKVSDQCVASSFPRYLLEAAIAKMATLESLRPIAEIVSSLEGAGPSARRSASIPSTAPGTSISTTPGRGSVSASSPMAATPNTESVDESPEATEELPRADFTWASFVEFVRTSSQKVLSEYLQRVTPREFRPGLFSVEGSDFYLASLQEPTGLQILKQLLIQYSGVQQWRLDFQESKASLKDARKNVAAAGSLRMEEERTKEERDKVLVQEATNSDAVKNALNTFSGSRVGGVSLIKD